MVKPKSSPIIRMKELTRTYGDYVIQHPSGAVLLKARNGKLDKLWEEKDGIALGGVAAEGKEFCARTRRRGSAVSAGKAGWLDRRHEGPCEHRPAGGRETAAGQARDPGCGFLQRGQSTNPGLSGEHRHDLAVQGRSFRAGGEIRIVLSPRHRRLERRRQSGSGARRRQPEARAKVQSCRAGPLQANSFGK